MSIGRLQAVWQTFWWGPSSPQLLAALRIGLALVAIWTHLSWWPEVTPLLDGSGSTRLVVDPAHGRGSGCLTQSQLSPPSAAIHGRSERAAALSCCVRRWG